METSSRWRSLSRPRDHRGAQASPGLPHSHYRKHLSRSRSNRHSRSLMRSHSGSLSPSPHRSRFSCSCSRSRSRSPVYGRSYRKRYRDLGSSKHRKRSTHAYPSHESHSSYTGMSVRYSPSCDRSRSRSRSYDSSCSKPRSYRYGYRSRSRSRTHSHKYWSRSRSHVRSCRKVTSSKSASRSPGYDSVFSGSRSRSQSPAWHHKVSTAQEHASLCESLDGRKDIGVLVSEFVDGIPMKQRKEREGTKIDDKHLAEMEEVLMKKLGIPVSFDSTKGKHVADANVYAVKRVSKRQPRQYMNRKGGFNKPLPAETISR